MVTPSLGRRDLHAARVRRHQVRAAERIDEAQPVDGDDLLVLLKDHLLVLAMLAQGDGGAVRQFRIAVRVTLQSSLYKSCSFERGGLHPKAASLSNVISMLP